MNREIYDNYVVHVYKNGSLTKAAKELKISQPALTQGLNSLEKQLGIKIFNRRANPITLTPEGEIYYRHIRRIEVLNDNYKKELENFKNSTDNQVTIGAPGVYVNTIVIPTLGKMNLDEYKVTIRTASIERLIGLADDGKIDCFISTVENLPRNYAKELIYKEEIVLCVPLEWDFDPEDNKQFEEQRFIFLRDNLPLQQSVNSYLSARKLKPERVIVTDQVAGAVHMVEHGIGITFAASEAARDKKVKTYPMDKIEGRNIYLAYDKELYRTRACEKFIEAIRK